MKPGVKFGVISGIISGFILMMALQNNWQIHPTFKFSGQFTLVLMFVFVFASIYQKKYSLQSGVISFKEGIKEGLMVSLISSLLMAFAYFLFVKFIDTNFIEKTITASEQFFRANGKTEVEILKNSNYIRENYLFTQMTGTIFFTLFVGSLFSLLCSAFLRTSEKV
jgi:hypothetical protein